jgi:hypothetical protein
MFQRTQEGINAEAKAAEATTRRSEVKVGRNATCPCGLGDRVQCLPRHAGRARAGLTPDSRGLRP